MPTRERLLELGTKLIAERGFANVTVGDIESAAGLVPRRGGLYKHFESKEAMVEESLSHRIDRLCAMKGLVQDIAELRTPTVLRSTAAAVLEELDQEQDLIKIFESDGARFPIQRERFFREVIEIGYHYAQRAFESIGAHGKRDFDSAALAAVALSALVNHRRQQWTFGTMTNPIDDDSFLDAWITLVWNAIGPPEIGVSER